jgi:ribosomal protein S18 acetylase RimI-like enzyme
MTPIIIRRATLEDLPDITRLWKAMMDYHRSFDERFDLVNNAEEIYLEHLTSHLSNFDYGLFVAVEDESVIGYTIGMILNNPAVFTLDRYGFVSEMAVDEAHQRKGTGKMLWNHLQKWFQRRGIQVMQLNVSHRNEKGYRFWKKMGCDEFLTIMWHDIPQKL